MKTRNKKRLILGLGNDILMDDGIGPRLVDIIGNRNKYTDTVFNTAALGGMELIEIIKDFTHVIIIDAIKTKGGIPGDIYHMTPSSFKETNHISNLHDISFLTALQLARKTDIRITENIDIIAVEIIEDRTFGSSFSPVIEAKFEEIKEKVFEIINKLIKDDMSE